MTDGGQDDLAWVERALASLEREVLRVRERAHAQATEMAVWHLDVERRVTKLETRLALYATLGGTLAGLAVGIAVQLVTGSG